MGPISVAVVRGSGIEARHRVHGVLVRDGRVVDVAGDRALVAWWRSSAKPFQALPLVRAEPDLPVEELAIACASHEARSAQLAAARALLVRGGASEDDLECGPENGSRLAHNCSGKHAGMLLVARRRGWPASGYRLPEHPLQGELHALVADAARMDAARLATAVDGCGVVTWALPLDAMAAAYAGFREREGAEPVLAAMVTRPDLVGGDESADTQLMRAVPGAVAKRGAEGLLCGVLADGTGFALKAEDGAQRPLVHAAGALLGEADLLRAPLANSRGETVGWIGVEL